jgi:hypothetical protein
MGFSEMYTLIFDSQMWTESWYMRQACISASGSIGTHHTLYVPDCIYKCTDLCPQDFCDRDSPGMGEASISLLIGTYSESGEYLRQAMDKDMLTASPGIVSRQLRSRNPDNSGATSTQVCPATTETTADGRACRDVLICTHFQPLLMQVAPLHCIGVLGQEPLEYST